jgi:hypothetical protein
VRLPTTEDNALTRRTVETCDVPEWFVCWPQGCPCGYLTAPPKECHYTPRQIQQCMSKISGPLLDRIGIQVEVPAHYRDLCSPADGEPSSAIRQIPDRHGWPLAAFQNRWLL